MGLPAKCMHFVGSPGWRGNSNSPRDEQLIRSVPEHDAHSERVLFGAPPSSRRGKQSAEQGSAGHKAIKARGGEPLRACVYYVVFRRCQGRENFSGLCPRNFSAQFLDKTSVGTSYKQIVWEREGVTPSQGGVGNNSPTALHHSASFCRRAAVESSPARLKRPTRIRVVGSPRRRVVVCSLQVRKSFTPRARSTAYASSE